MSTRLVKLKSKKQISALFMNGKNISCYPFRITFLIEEGDPKCFFLTVVPKRNFKKAVDRNRIRRQLKSVIENTTFSIKSQNKTVFFSVGYIGTEKPSHSYILKGLKETFRIFNEKLARNE